MNRIELIPIELPLIRRGDDLVRLIAESLEQRGYSFMDGDVLVLASKIVSKARGYYAKASSIRPGLRARILSKLSGIPPHVIEHCMGMYGPPILLLPYSTLLSEERVLSRISRNTEKARSLLKSYPNMYIYRTSWGFSSDCGVDFSNMPDGFFTYPPPDPGKEALSIRREIREKLGVDVAVIITDTEPVTLRPGTLEIAIGGSGVKMINNEFAEPDLYGKPKIGGVDLIADMLANAAGLLMGQTSRGVPAVLIRGLDESFFSEETFPSKEEPELRRLAVVLWRNLLFKLVSIVSGLSFRRKHGKVSREL